MSSYNGVIGKIPNVETLTRAKTFSVIQIYIIRIQILPSRAVLDPT